MQPECTPRNWDTPLAIGGGASRLKIESGPSVGNRQARSVKGATGRPSSRKFRSESSFRSPVVRRAKRVLLRARRKTARRECRAASVLKHRLGKAGERLRHVVSHDGHIAQCNPSRRQAGFGSVPRQTEAKFSLVFTSPVAAAAAPEVSGLLNFTAMTYLPCRRGHVRPPIRSRLRLRSLQPRPRPLGARKEPRSVAQA